MTIGRATYNNPVKNDLQVTTVPAPFGGIDSRRPFAYMAPDACVYAFNMMPSEFGMQVRKGYSEHQTGIEEPINTLITFTSESTYSTITKLFAATTKGIYDVTVRGSIPIKMLNFEADDFRAGFGSFTHYTDQANKQWLFYTDGVNGMFVYDASEDSWGRPDGIVGPNIERVAFIVVHKLRIWLIERDSTKAWYLPVASTAGNAEEFHFGSKFKHGGELVGLYNWTIDGGEGLDDHLVAISSAGDVLPFKGDDPSIPDAWKLVGSFYVGDIPAGRNIAQEQGGMLHILSNYGLVAMSELLQGGDASLDDTDSMSYKISSLVRNSINEVGNVLGWDIVTLPSIGALVLVVPGNARGASQHFVFNLASKGWGMWRDLPIRSLIDWRGNAYFGTPDGRICVMDATKDNVKINQGDDDPTGVPIEFSLLTSYQRYDADGLFKQVQLIRPDFIAEVMPEYAVKPLYEFVVTEPAAPFPRPQVSGIPDGEWDLTFWDQCVWAVDLRAGQAKVTGGGGIGRNVAIAIRGSAVVETRLGSFDIMLTVGGPV